MSPATDISHLAHIRCPSALRDLPGWLVWRFEPHDNPGGKPRKVPYYVSGGRRHGQHGTREDRAQLTTFDAARAAAARRGFNGVGFAPQADFNIVALDFDNCVTAGEVHPEVLETLANTYAEYSPSGCGIRALFTGQLGNSKDHGSPFGLELFSTKGFVTFTGQVLPVVELMGNADTVAPVDAATLALVQRRFKRAERDIFEPAADHTPLGLTPTQIAECLEVLPNDLDYDTWLQVGMALHHETAGAGFDVWDAWSSKSSKYTSTEYGLARWESFGRSGGLQVTARSLVRLAGEHGAHVIINGPASAAEFDAVSAAPAPASTRFPVIPAAAFASTPAPEWIIKGVLPLAELVVLYGASGSGKSFMALDMAMAIARGMEWRGKRTRQGRVVYIAAEGAGGFRNRLKAYADHAQLDLADVPFGVINVAPNLLLKDDALAVARSIGRAALVVVDTWAQVQPGGDENSGESMGKALAHCKGIHRATGAVVLLIHHSGKDSSKGARGWSGLRAAADAELEVTRQGALRQISTTKQKDGEDGLAWGFALEVVGIGADGDGDPITSCVVVPAEVPAATLMRVLGPKEEIVNAVIQEMAQAQTSGIEVNAVINEAIKRLPPPADGKRDTRRQHAKRALESLCKGDDAPYWLDPDDSTISIC